MHGGALLRRRKKKSEMLFMRYFSCWSKLVQVLRQSGKKKASRDERYLDLQLGWLLDR